MFCYTRIASTLLFVSLGWTILIGHADARTSAAPKQPLPSDPPSTDTLTYGDPVVFKNLSLVPVISHEKGPFQRYTLLEEGLQAHTLTVRELAGNSDSAQVNKVEVRNRGKDPVFLLGGEMIIGGKQDRIVRQDMVVDANGKWTQVSVFCVEQKRWAGQQMQFTVGGALAHAKLLQAARKGSQIEVWNEVTRKNQRHNAMSSTQTYRRTIQNPAVRAKIEHYVTELRRLFPQYAQLSGVVFAVNGRIRIADLFGNPDLFGKLQDKLLAAYVLEALDDQPLSSAKPVNKAAAEKWLTQARKAPPSSDKKAGGRVFNLTKESDETTGNETYDPKAKLKLRETYLMKGD